MSLIIILYIFYIINIYFYIYKIIINYLYILKKYKTLKTGDKIFYFLMLKSNVYLVLIYII